MPSPSAEVIRKFRKRVAASIDYHRELLLAVHQKKRQASLESMLAEQFALNTAVLWEVFLSDLVMAYVGEEPSTYMRGLESRIAQSVKERFGGEVVRCVRIELPDDIPIAKVGAWLDPKDFNLTFRSADALKTKANSLLAAQFAKKFSLEPERSDLLDYILALRNYLAHRSTGARRQLQITATALSGPNHELSAKVVDVGAYLKTRTANGDSRAALLADRISTLAGSLA